MTKKKAKPTVDSEVERLMQEIDESEFAGSDVDRELSIELYESISDMCLERANLIRSEASEAIEDD